MGAWFEHHRLRAGAETTETTLALAGAMAPTSSVRVLLQPRLGPLARSRVMLLEPATTVTLLLDDRARWARGACARAACTLARARCLTSITRALA